MVFNKKIWQGVACLGAFLLSFSSIAAVILEENRSAIDANLGTVSELMVSEDDGSTYTAFTPKDKYLNEDGTGNSRALIKDAIDIGRRHETEGAVLLKNTNSALPLQKGSSVTLLGARSHRTILNSGMGQKSQGCYITLEQALGADKTDFTNTMIPASGWGATPSEPIADFNFADLKLNGDGVAAGAGFEVNPTMSAVYEAVSGELQTSARRFQNI